MDDDREELGGRGKGRILYYDLVPVREEPEEAGGFSIASAAVVSCIVTGRHLDGIGGPGFAVCAEVVDALDMNRHGGKPRMVMEAEEFERMHAALVAARTGLSDPDSAAKALAEVEATLAAIDVKTIKGE
jgi:hypothetical protein